MEGFAFLHGHVAIDALPRDLCASYIGFGRSTMPMKTWMVAVLAGALAVTAVGCADDESQSGADVSAADRKLTEENVDAFFRNWLKMLDENAPVEEFYKYLVDGDFEEWSYPGVEIKNRQELEAYFNAAWGTIERQENKVESLDVTDQGNGTFQIVSKVDWSATTKDGKAVASRLQFTVTVGSGTSQADPDGKYPKVLRYKMIRL
jgi:hypothetical protein